MIAGAVEWPGWCRIARSEAEALQALLDYGPRYATAVNPTGSAFQPPTHMADLNVVERLDGSSTTDFGAPDAMPAADQRPFTPADLPRAEIMMQACWQVLDTAVQTAAGTPLTKGPRGGGRDLESHRRPRLRSRKRLPAPPGPEASPRRRPQPDRTAGAAAASHSGSPRRRRSRRTAGARAARRQNLARPLLRAPRHLARPGPCLGNRRPRQHCEPGLTPLKFIINGQLLIANNQPAVGN
ncbi:MAG: hypothetical protein IPG51_22960 [Chloroflexi bacterium]|nr:hypothetical protein [Chloroflexota bacterium]